MSYRLWMTAVVGIGLVALLAGPQPARAGGDDPLITHPDVFVVFDTSGSMSSNAGGGRSRFTAAQEVLTGTGAFSYNPTGTCPSPQLDDGIMDLYRGMVRFGFGSFDDDGGGCRQYGRNLAAYGDDPRSTDGDGDTVKGRGIKGRRGNNTNMDRCYYNNGCLIDVVKPGAPWDIDGNNDDTQQEICSMGYHGCTPVAASLHDARYYFEHYESEIGYSDPFGRHDGDCRPQFVLLMTDGQEWPPCRECPEDGSGDLCPENNSDPHNDWSSRCSWYGNEAMQAKYLWDIGVPVYVVAFGNMGPGNRRRMHRIARAGAGMPQGEWSVSNLADLEHPAGPKYDEPKAFIASDQLALKVAFAVILDSILAGSVSRTATATTPSSSTYGKALEATAWFEMGIAGITWNGFLALDELRDDDNDGVAEPHDRIVAAWGLYTPQAGEHLAALPSAGDRRFLTIVEDPRSETYYDLSAGDYDLPRTEGMGTAGLYPFKASNSLDASYDFDHSLMCLTNTGELNPDTFAPFTPDQLARYIKAYVRGEPMTLGTTFLRMALEPQLGDIFHSSPQIVPPPAALNPDYRFEAYYQENKLRHTMVYVGANDGLLHAFVAEDNDSSDGTVDPLTELWGFMPTRVLSTIQKIRHGGHTFFVDGTPVIRDVYFHNMDAPDGDPSTDTCLKDGGGDCIEGTYRTMLVGSQRAGGDAYFALDVTDPDNPGYLWEYRTSMPADDDDPATDHDDYVAQQCKGTALQTWSRPIIGQVWLKDGSSSEFLNKSVVIVPGGYLPSMEIGGFVTCADLMEATVSANTLHVLDAETGELLRKFHFSGNAHMADLEAALADYYDAIANGTSWNHWGAGVDFDSGDFDWANSTGWNCAELRPHAGVPLHVPAGVVDEQFCEYTHNSGSIAYQQECCTNAGGTKCPNFNGNAHGNCYYRYTEYDNGNIEIELKTVGCYLASADNEGKLHAEIGGDFAIEGAAATPVAYSTKLGSFLSRVFVASSKGKIYRVIMDHGQYEEGNPEGEKIVAHDSDPTKDWSADLWFDAIDTAFVSSPVQTERRPITIDPTLALNGERNLILYYGTGPIDDMDYHPGVQEYFYAVEETRDATDPTILNPKGELVDVKDDFGPSERLYNKPLIIGGNVYFSTFQPDTNACGSGNSKVYTFDYEDFNPLESAFAPKSFAGIAKGPSMRWTAQGPQVVVTSKDAVTDEVVTENLGEVELVQSARALYWGEVL